jgi:ABC-type multidrug transport system ATPase subunit
MEEADLLADEVAIIRKGELAALGSPLELKTKHGTALQFSLLVEKADVASAEDYIRNFFSESMDWVEVQPSDAGNVVVKIKTLKERASDDPEGVAVDKLSAFVSWLDGDESPVTEYGFSNSSLEEVFLQVTEGDEEEVPIDQTDDAAAEDIVEGTTEDAAEDVEAAEATESTDLSTFRPKLSVANQTRVLLLDFWKRSWTGKGSIGNYCIFGLFLAGCVLTVLGFGWQEDPIPSFALIIAFVSLLLVTILGPIYADRAGGQFYLMRTQGLLPAAYIASAGLFGFSAQFAYTFLALTLVFAMPIFREAELCEKSETSYYSCWGSFGDRPMVEDAAVIWNYYDEYEGQEVTLKALRSPGGYGMIFGIIIFYALSTAGITLTTAFFPGYRIPLVFIMFLTLAAAAWPLAATRFVMEDDDDFYDCMNTTDPKGICDDTFFLNSTDAYFLNCVGLEVNSFAYSQYCFPPSAALLPQFGLFQTLSMTYTSKLRFVSEPENYVRDVFIPSIQDAKCNGDTCVFPQANRVYGLNILFMFIGAIIFVLLGCMMAYVLAFPIGPFLKIRQAFTRMLQSIRCSRQKARSGQENKENEEEKKEVSDEREVVENIVRPFTTEGDGDLFPHINHDTIPRDEIAPVVMHKLRKVYPSLGGVPPKIALESLDLQVPKGQVLGLLGKNGAGKTTALKILAGAHDLSGGIGLVAGYDCDFEKISVFERLGNCAQFDVVWGGRSVQYHVEFFASLKGLPKGEVKKAARDVASAVGLGTDEVYQRNAGALSGGMRRRLSIAMALIGSPAVVILDEPTTG